MTDGIKLNKRSAFVRADGTLDMGYLRLSAVYKLFVRHLVSDERAIELLKARAVRVPETMITIWKRTRQYREYAIAKESKS